LAVDRITNKQVVNKSTIDRSGEVSQRGTTGRGNASESYVPGLNFDKNYSITLKDVDTSIITHVKNVIKPTIREANEQIKVPILYGNEERWFNVRKRGVLRDKNNSLILPVVVLKRTAVDKNETLSQGFEHDVKRKYSDFTRQTQWSKENRYDRFSVLTGRKPANINVVTSMPNFVNITYEFVLLTAFIEQMNTIVEEFVEFSNTYWGDSEEYKFLCTVDSISDASEVNAGEERLIKSTFSVNTKAYLLPEYTNSVVTNKISQIQKRLKPTEVIFGFEGDATDEQIKIG